MLAPAQICASQLFNLPWARTPSDAGGANIENHRRGSSDLFPSCVAHFSHISALLSPKHGEVARVRVALRHGRHAATRAPPAQDRKLVRPAIPLPLLNLRRLGSHMARTKS